MLAIWTNIDGYAATNTANPYYGTACMWQCLVCICVLCYAHIQSKLTDWSSNVYIQVLKVSIMGCALIMKPIWGGDNYKRLLFWCVDIQYIMSNLWTSSLPHAGRWELTWHTSHGKMRLLCGRTHQSYNLLDIGDHYHRTTTMSKEQQPRFSVCLKRHDGTENVFEAGRTVLSSGSFWKSLAHFFLVQERLR